VLGGVAGSAPVEPATPPRTTREKADLPRDAGGRPPARRSLRARRARAGDREPMWAASAGRLTRPPAVPPARGAWASRGRAPWATVRIPDGFPGAGPAASGGGQGREAVQEGAAPAGEVVAALVDREPLRVAARPQGGGQGAGVRDGRPLAGAHVQVDAHAGGGPLGDLAGDPVGFPAGAQGGGGGRPAGAPPHRRRVGDHRPV